MTAARLPPPPRPVSPPRGSDCTCFRIRSLSRRVTQLYDHALAPSGLRTTQFSLLSHLGVRRGVAIGTLADRLDTDRTTLTRNLRPLVAAGCIELAASDDDRRVRNVRLTDEGRARYAQARRLWRAAQGAVDRTLGKDEVDALHRLCDRLMDTFDTMDRS